MQEINNDIALAVRQPNVESASDAMAKNVSVSDMLAQISQRRAETANYNAEAPLRALRLQNETQTLTENNLIKQAQDRGMELDENHHARLNEDTANAFLQSQQVPGVGSAGYLMPRVKKMADQSEAETQQALIDHTTKQNALLKMVADPMENFQKSGKTPADWAALRANVLPADPGLGKQLGPTYIPETHDPIIKQIVDQKAQQDDIAEKLSKAQQERSLALTTPEGQAKEVARLNAAAAQANGVPLNKLDQETKDANFEKVYGTKIVRKTPGRAQFSPPMTADKLPPDAATVRGEPITDRDPKNEYTAVYHNGEVIGYEPEKPKTMATTAATLAVQAAGGDQVAQAALDKLNKPTAASLAVQAANGDQMAARALKLFPSQANAPVNLSEDAITMAAKKYAAGANLDNLGMNAKAEKDAILNKAAELSKGTDIATQVALYKSNTGALTQLQKNAASINAFENTALSNIGVFEKTMKSVVDSGSPIINKPLREINEQGLGSPEVAAFKAARQIATTEIAKVLNNPNSSVALSDSARQEAQSLIGEGATMAQLYKIVETLKQDMVNRRKGFQDEIADRTKAIQNLSPVAHDAAQPETTIPPIPPAGKIIRYDAQGNRIP